MFRKAGNHKAAEYMGKLRAHINAVGTDEALKSLGVEMAGSKGDEVAYEGERGGFDSMEDFTTAYLGRYGITPVFDATPGNAKKISSISDQFKKGSEEDGYLTGDLYFKPADPTFKNKLEEAQHLPGLESSEDLSKIMGSPVTHLTTEVIAKLDAKYGVDNWIVKPYTDDAFAGYGIFFPQRAKYLKENARNDLWHAGENLAKYGFQLNRDKKGIVTGLKHENGDVYDFGSDEYKDKIYGVARQWADKAKDAAVAENDQGVALMDRDGGLTSNSFMAQPAFKAVGVNEEDRRLGRTFEGGVHSKGEGRTHIVTRNGKAELVPYTTWLKGESLPVVFDDEETKKMSQAALDAINALPESERQGQVYAPDIMRAEDGYKVVEANPSNVSGPSGYLGDNPFIIDSYVSHIMGKEPAHAQFIRKLLSKKAAKKFVSRQFEKSFLRFQQKAESFFATCDRDDEGHCIAGSSGGSSAGGKESGPVSYTSENVLDLPSAQEFMDELEESESSDSRVTEIGVALTDEHEKLVVEAGGKLAAVASISQAANGTVDLWHLGSLQKGAGKQILDKLKAKYQRIVARTVVEDAIGFYEKMGFKRLSGNDWVWDRTSEGPVNRLKSVQ